MDELKCEYDQINELIESLEKRRSIIASKMKNNYIGIVAVGDLNYWDEYYINLGNISEYDAQKWCDAACEMDGIEPDYTRYFVVSPEDSAKYSRWYELDKIKSSIGLYSETVRNSDIFRNAREEAERLLKQVTEELKIDQSYKHIYEFWNSQYSFFRVVKKETYK